VIEKHPEYEKADLLNRMVEPERMFTFRVVWMADDGSWHTNIGYRCQFNGAIGPYKGGLRSRRTCTPHHQVPGLRADLQEQPDRPAHRRRQGRL
jgi:glutamate dehydrogenase (NADP+)